VKKYIPFLFGALIVQAGLCAFFLTRKDATATFQANEKLLSFTFDKVDRVQITDGTGKKVELKKQEAGWVIPDYFTYPVAAKKLETFGQAMDSFKKSWPLGTSAIAAKQFKVVPEQFERELVFFAGDKKLQTLYLGTSPSFRKVHARVDDVMNTYSIDQNTFDIAVDSKEWIDKRFFAALDKTKVKSLVVGTVTLEQQNGNFILAGIPADKETMTDKTAALVAKVLNADFDEVMDLKEKVTLGEKVDSFTLTSSDDQKHGFEVYKTPAVAETVPAPTGKDKTAAAEKDKPKVKAPEDFIVILSNSPYAFKVKEQKIKDLLKVDSAGLVKAKDAKDAKGAETAKG
jgi:hypothetical protein